MSRRPLPLPSPAELKPKPKTSYSPITFRLNDDEYEGLLKLAADAGMGHSTLVRRIVETYVRDHAKSKRNSK